MKNLAIIISLIILFLFLLGAVITTPLAWIGTIIVLFGLYQIRQKKKGKVTFSKPGWIVAAGIILCFVFVGNVTETANQSHKEKTVTQENKEKVASQKEVKKQENKEENDETEQKAKEQDNQKELTKQETEKKLEEKAKNLGLVAATVARVIDGDTFELSDGRKVRLIGVNTPESTTRHEEYGKEASNYTKSKLEGKQIWLQKDVSETDRYGRLLRIVWLQVPNDDMNEKEIRSKMFNADLVLNGYAEPSTYPPDVKYAEFFRKFAREAREKEVGLWAYGEYGTTKGDLDPSSTGSSSSSSSKSSSSSNQSGNKGSSNNNSSSGSSSSPSTSSSGGAEYFANCTELRKVYPNGVPSDHPAYQSKMDRDKDGWACER